MDLSCLVVPALCAFVFPFATLSLKRAMEGERQTWSVVLLSNWAVAVVFSPWLLAGAIPIQWRECWQPLLAGLFFLAGQCAAFKSFQHDLTIAIPVQGTKVLMVAFLSVLALGQSIGMRTWIGAALSIAAIHFLNEPGKKTEPGKGLFGTLFWAGAAAFAFAAFDVSVQKWSHAWGGYRFGAWAFAAQAVLSLGLLSLPRARPFRIRGRLRGWALSGAFAMALITLGLVITIANCANATQVNLLFNSRCVWSVLAVWFAGRWFQDPEAGQRRSTLARRLGGAVMMLCAIALAL